MRYSYSRELNTDHRLLVTDSNILKLRKKIAKSYNWMAVNKLREKENEQAYTSHIQIQLHGVKWS